MLLVSHRLPSFQRLRDVCNYSNGRTNGAIQRTRPVALLKRSRYTRETPDSFRPFIVNSNRSTLTGFNDLFSFSNKIGGNNQMDLF